VKRRANVFSTTGFTLIEVVVTLTILSFILLIIFGAFRLGLSAWERGEWVKEEYQKVRIVTQLISRQIKSIVPYKIKTEKAEGNYLAFEGKPKSLKFVSTLSLKATQPEGFVYSIYEFKEGGKKGGRLILYEQKALNKDFFEEGPDEELAVSLFEGISDVRFEYYQEEDPNKDREGGWVDEWNTKDEKVLPRAVKITITYPAHWEASKNEKDEGENSSITVLASIPSHRFEEVRMGPMNRTLSQTSPGAVQ
jgi:prepilin-type N-terminal cleavage/methylation domain-containing protein